MNKIRIGKVYLSEGVKAYTEKSETFLSQVKAALSRHMHLDFGDVDSETEKRNKASIENGRIQSMYSMDIEKPIIIITEKDRETTQILLPSEE